jgi:heme-degrading monooxygenase HmoA
MLYNVAKLKEDIDFDDVEFALGEVYRYAGFISDEGSVGEYGDEGDHIAIVTYWKSFEEHEQSHKDLPFKQAFAGLMKYCTDTKELGYNLLWQGEK